MSLSSLEIKTALVSLQFISTNSVRNKFESLADLVITNLDVLTISETKTDETFPELKFIIGGFSESYRLGCTENGAGVLLCQKRHSCQMHHRDYS